MPTQGTKREENQSRPEKYTPREALFVSLYCLHRDLEFESVLYFPVSLSSPCEVTGYRFKRADGIKVNHFQVIKDKKVGNNDPQDSYPTIGEWLAVYEAQIKKKAISEDDISIVPLVLVQQNRKHFNTLLVYKNYAYIIEPKSNHMTLKGAYPIVSNISGYQFNSLCIGKQPFYDDWNCGAHHINFSEIIMQLSPGDLSNPKQLKRFLCRSHLSRRSDDQAKIDCIGQEIDSLRDISGVEVQRALSNQIKNKKPSVEKLLEDAIQDINVNYLNPYKGNKFSLFSRHTRGETARFIISELQALRNKSFIPAEDRLQTASVLLYSCYVGIHTASSNSKLGCCIQKILASLLDCEEEYKDTMQQSCFTFNRSLKLQHIFRDKMFLRVNGNKEHEIYLKKLTNSFIKIDEIDTSWLHWLYQKKKSDKRERLFEAARVTSMAWYHKSSDVTDVLAKRSMSKQ